MSSINESEKTTKKPPTRKAMGRGLEALLGGKGGSNTGINQKVVKASNREDLTVDQIGATSQLEIAKIIANPDQPRKTFNQEGIEELANSIKTQGLIQPIVVAKKNPSDPQSDYVIVAGERRWRACKLAGLAKVDVVVRDHAKYTNLDNDLASLIENIQREDLNPVDLAKSYQKIMQSSQITQEALATYIGRSRVKIANTIRLLRLPEEVLARLVKKELSEGQARALLGLESKDLIVSMADKIRAESLSVRQVEAEVKKILQNNNENTSRPNTISQKANTGKSEAILKTEATLRDIFATKVSINGNAKRGTIELYYTGEESLNRLLHLMKGLR